MLSYLALIINKELFTAEKRFWAFTLCQNKINKVKIVFKQKLDRIDLNNFRLQHHSNNNNIRITLNTKFQPIQAKLVFDQIYPKRVFPVYSRKCGQHH